MPTSLVSLADYKTYKKLTKTDSDAELEMLVVSTSALVKNYIGHSLIDYYSTPLVQVFNTSPQTSVLQLTEWPIKDVILVEYRDKYTETYSILDPTEYYLNTATDSVYIQKGYWPAGLGSVKITYTAGYPTTPEDIKLAILDLIHHYHKEEYKEGKSLGNASINNTPSGASSAIRATNQAWPPHVLRVLSLYKNG